MNPLLLLKAIPIRDVLWAAAAAALLWFGIHERHVQAQHDAQANARIAQVQEIHNAKVENIVQSRLDAAIAKYRAAHPPPADAPVRHVVCYAARPSKVPDRSRSVSGGDGAGALIPFGPASEYGRFDPAPQLSEVGKRADHEIEHLQAKIALLQATIRAYQAGGLVKR